MLRPIDKVAARIHGRTNSTFMSANSRDDVLHLVS